MDLKGLFAGLVTTGNSEEDDEGFIDDSATLAFVLTVAEDDESFVVLFVLDRARVAPRPLPAGGRFVFPPEEIDFVLFWTTEDFLVEEEDKPLLLTVPEVFVLFVVFEPTEDDGLLEGTEDDPVVE